MSVGLVTVGGRGVVAGVRARRVAVLVGLVVSPVVVFWPGEGPGLGSGESGA